MSFNTSNLSRELPSQEDHMMVIDDSPSIDASAGSTCQGFGWALDLFHTRMVTPAQQAENEEKLRRVDEFKLVSANAELTNLTDAITRLNKKHLDWNALKMKRDRLLRLQRSRMMKVSRICDYLPSESVRDRLISFRKDLISDYDSVSEDDPSMVWCPVMGDYMPRRVVTQAHIVNQNISESILADVLGFGEHTWNTKNGLVLCAPYQRLIDLGKAVIIPKIAKRTGDRDYYFLLLSHTEEIGSLEALIWGEELEFRKLEFIDYNHLPDFKYLYLHFVIAVLRRHRLDEDRESAAMDLEPHAAIARKLWNIPVTRLTRPILYTFSRNFGLLTHGQAVKFWGITNAASVFTSLTEDEQKDVANKANSLGFAAEEMMFFEQEEEEKWGWKTKWGSEMQREWERDTESKSEDEDEEEDRGWKRWRDSDVDSGSEDDAEDDDQGWKKWQLPEDDARAGKKARM